MGALADDQDPSEQFCHALRRRQKVDGDLLEFLRLLNSSEADQAGSQNLDDVDDL